jgi:uncharacterized protein YutE (UPF0331/DUF86 family)
LQIAIEDCLDIGKHIIAEEAFRVPKDNQDIFVVLYDEGIIPKRLLTRLIDMAKFRNLVVHDYVRIDNAIVYGILNRRLVDFEAYARAIQKYLMQLTQT